MALTVEVNVWATNAHPGPNDYYEGNFYYQQVWPLDQIYVKPNGDIHAPANSEEIDVTLNWVATAVQIQNKLCPAKYRSPHNQSVWLEEITQGNPNPNPGPGNPAPPSGNNEITVPDGPNDDRLTIKDKNTPSDPEKKYKSALAIEVEFEGATVLLVDDPKIINAKGVGLIVKPGKPNPPPGSQPPPSTNTNN